MSDISVKTEQYLQMLSSGLNAISAGEDTAKSNFAATITSRGGYADTAMTFAQLNTAINALLPETNAPMVLIPNGAMVNLTLPDTIFTNAYIYGSVTGQAYAENCTIFVKSGGVYGAYTDTARGERVNFVISSGGTVVANVANAGNLNLYSGGYVGLVHFELAGTATIGGVYSGRIDGGTTLVSGGTLSMDGATGIFSAFSGGVLSVEYAKLGFSAAILAGGTMSGGTLISGSIIRVSSGGVIKATNVEDGGLFIYTGGSATGIKVSNTFHLYGGASFDTMVYGGQERLDQPATVASGTTIFSGYQNVAAGAVAYDTIISAGWLIISSTGTGLGSAVRPVVYSNGKIRCAGWSSDVVIHSGGYLEIGAGGTALDVTSMTGGTVELIAGGVITYK